MSLHGDVALQEIGHGRAFQLQQFHWNLTDHLLGCGDGRLVLAEEHRTVYGEMVIVDAVGGIEVHPPLPFGNLQVGRDPLLVPVQCVAVLAALDVDMCRHMDQVSGIRHQFAQPVAGHQGLLRGWRHFHQVDI